MSQEHYKVTQDESSGNTGLYRRITCDDPGGVSGWEKIASVEDFRHIADLIAIIPDEPDSKEISKAINAIEELASAASRGLCDSRTGFCTMHRRVLTTIPYLHQCARIIRNQQQKEKQ